jgi:hypothetical protein
MYLGVSKVQPLGEQNSGAAGVPCVHTGQVCFALELKTQQCCWELEDVVDAGCRVGAVLKYKHTRCLGKVEWSMLGASAESSNNGVDQSDTLLCASHPVLRLAHSCVMGSGVSGWEIARTYRVVNCMPCTTEGQ